MKSGRRQIQLVVLVSALLLLKSLLVHSAEQSSLTFQRALDLRNANANSSEILKVLGEPGEKKDIRSQGQLWSYFESLRSGERLQRLGILIDPRSQLALSWTWMVLPGEEFYEPKRFEAKFGGSKKFKKHVVGKWVSHDAWAREITLENQELGINASIHEVSGKVFVIGMGSKTKSAVRPIAGK